MKNINDFIGIKFEYGKSSFEFCDCWGLVCLYYKEMMNIDLRHNKDDFKEDISFENAIKKKEEILKNLEEVNQARKVGDIILYENIHGKPHVAVYFGGGYFLETFEESGSVARKKTNHTRLTKKKVYRYKRKC